MISEEQATRLILQGINSLPSRRLPLMEAQNCFLTEECIARLPLPNFDNSAMDGYAVRAADCSPGAHLTRTGEQPAGVDRGLELSSGEAIRIFTGAPLPKGADAIVMQEDVSVEGDELIINTSVNPGDFVRQRGCDLAEGQKMLDVGARLTSVAMAALAAQGFTDVLVGARVTAAALSTGDELVAPGRALEPGQIYDSNSILLRGLLADCGADVQLVEHVVDSEDALIAALKRAAASNVLLISGGVSVGEHDLVKSALAAVGADINLWRVAIKPGKPFLYGQIGDCRVFGLPGNPVSGFVTFLKFVRPAILKMMGAADDQLHLPRAVVRLAEGITGDEHRPHYIRGRVTAGTFQPTGRQESHALFGLSRSNALLRVPPRQNLQARDLVEVELWA